VSGGADDYAATVAWLQALEVQRGWDLKLDRMHAALALRGHPERAWRALHVAGTNGKGSTAALAESVLRAAGRRTGLYTSPHLVDFAERIRAGGRTIPPADVVRLVGAQRAALERAGLALTHFEFATLLAFEWFAEIGVDVAVIEVGLGGRLDATNVLAPLACAITSIALDHEEWLGATLAAIAREKAGILRAGVPAAIGRGVPPDAWAAIAAQAAAVGAPPWRAGVDGGLADGGVFHGPGGVVWDGLAIGLPGAVQRANAEVALAMLALAAPALALDVAAVRRGLAAARWPGRLAVVGERPRVVLDGAHNPAGVAALVDELPRLVGDRPLTLVFAVMADKQWDAMLARLVPRARRAIATRVGRRGLAPEAIVASLAGRLPAVAIDDPAAAVRTALERAAPDEAVLVTGSLFLVGAAYGVLDVPLFERFHGWDGLGRHAAR
jgi:dihydrofolate synthase/folylpolyglutamate synthase